MRHKPPILTLDLGLTPLPWRRFRHWRVGAARHQVRETQSVRKDWILGFNRWRRAGFGGSSILPPHHWMRGNNLLRRILWSGCVGAAVAAPLTARLVRENVAAHPARPHGCAAKQTHAHAVVCIKAALAAVATIGETTRLDVGAHLDNLEALAPVLGRGAAAVKAGACRKGAMMMRRHELDISHVSDRHLKCTLRACHLAMRIPQRVAERRAGAEGGARRETCMQSVCVCVCASRVCGKMEKWKNGKMASCHNCTLSHMWPVANC